MNLLNDIYYSKEYTSLYLKEHEKLFEFRYQEDDKIFYNLSIKRPILNIANKMVTDGYFDLETAYGYGGYYVNTEDKNFIEKALAEYAYRCNEENIIAEFIRFHPFNDFPTKHNNVFDLNIYDRDVVIKNLPEDVISSYTSKVRNIVKRATEKVEILQSSNIDKFIELYNATMLKNDAEDFYFFDKKYYMNLLKNNNVKLYEVKYENTIIAMAFFMFKGAVGHYHLSANTELSYKVNSNYALLNYVFDEAKFMLGGGTTSKEDDSLFKFKKKFSKELKPFYISGKVFNKEIYDKYNKIWQVQNKDDVKYFLKYRLEIK